MNPSTTTFLLILILWISCCSSDEKDSTQVEIQEEEMMATGEGTASITDVSVSGGENEYTFSVTIQSNDTGCNQYADWWEVVDEDGQLIHRRILAHSHVNEQPFTRSGGPFEIDENKIIYIRAHMNNTGYGTKVFKGSVSSGFTADNLSSDFAKELADIEPLPSGCAF